MPCYQNNMNKIALFGGAFNPITKAHIKCAQEILKYGFNKVWFVPCNVSASGKVLESGQHRIKMCDIASQNVPNVETCDIEIKDNLVGTPYDILSIILNKYKTDNTKFYFAMGMDNANSVHLWPEYKKSIELLPYVIFPRGVSTTDWFKKPPHIYISSLEFTPEISMSSTQFRKEYSSTRKSELVEKDVLDYIKTNKLY